MRRGLAPSREQARTAIEQGRVLVGGAPADKASRQVGPDEPVVVQGPPPRYVSRGGEKLEAALAAFDLRVGGVRALDAGASTGGFTDCLLQHGAASVAAVDVGYGQLHERLRADPRVSVHERSNLRHLDPRAVGGPFDLVVADLSFISLRLVADVLVAAASPGGELVVLVKPQFEVGRAEASKGRGVIRDPASWAGALRDVVAAVASRGAVMMGAVVSPITGSDGNVEFLVHFRAPTADAPETTPVTAGAPGPEVLVEQVVREAVARHGTERRD
ncbi:MAG: TlyA family RNA methyltransferase [Acidimicrobiales bacterium]|nr:TlyA family RNA methyltransferase [Acidimicrobiales bacterium]